MQTTKDEKQHSRPPVGFSLATSHFHRAAAAAAAAQALFALHGAKYRELAIDGLPGHCAVGPWDEVGVRRRNRDVGHLVALRRYFKDADPAVDLGHGRVA